MTIQNNVEKDWWINWFKADYSIEALKTRSQAEYFKDRHGNVYHRSAKGISGDPISQFEFWEFVFRSTVGKSYDVTSPITNKSFDLLHNPKYWENGSINQDFDQQKNKIPDVLNYCLNSYRGHLSAWHGIVFSSFEDDWLNKSNVDCGQAAILCSLTRTRNHLHARFANALFSEPVNFEGKDIHTIDGSSAGFSNSTFLQDVSFAGATFKNEINFQGAHFLGTAKFTEATFNEDCVFDDATFTRGVDCNHFRTMKNFSMGNPNLNGEANFEHAELGNPGSETSFIGSWNADQTNFRDAIFHGKVQFRFEPLDGHIEFLNAKFNNNAIFAGSTFKFDARFDGANFEGDAIFEGSTFDLDARFDNTTFSALAVFYKCGFSSGAYFTTANFLGEVLFDKARFSDQVIFTEAKFGKRASFDHVNFHEATDNDDEHTSTDNSMCFRKANFKNFANFTNATFSAQFKNTAGAFTGTTFIDVVDFSNSNTFWMSALDGVKFGNMLILDDLGENEANSEFRKNVLKNAKKSQEFLARLEGGCRTIKNFFAKEGNEISEQRYHRYQLMARQRRKNTPCFERAFSYFYGKMSNYGSSIATPLLLLVALVAFSGISLYFFSVFYGIISGPEKYFGLNLELESELVEALDLSALNIFRPFEIWRPSATRDYSIVASLKDQLSAFDWLLIKIALTLQSFLGLVLVFLAALALRRRFQLG